MSQDFSDQDLRGRSLAGLDLSGANFSLEVKPENLVFNANLQEFAQQVNYICNLETVRQNQSTLATA